MKDKIVKAFLTILSVLLISETFFIVVHFVVAGSYNRILDTLVAEYQLSKKTNDLVNSFYDLIQYSNDQERTRAFNSNLAGLQALLGKLDKDLAKNNSWTSYVGTKNTITAVIDQVNKGVADISAENFSGVTADYLKAAEYDNYVRENTGSLLLKELESTEQTEARVDQTRFWSELLGLILFAIVFVGSLLYGLSFAKSFFAASRGSSPPPKNNIPPNGKINNFS